MASFWLLLLVHLPMTIRVILLKNAWVFTFFCYYYPVNLNYKISRTLIINERFEIAQYLSKIYGGVFINFNNNVPVCKK